MSSLADLLTIKNIIEWIGLMSLIGALAMLVDKQLALSNWSDRISERTLWTAAFSGGFPGVILGGIVFHHKIAKAEFWPPVALAATLWVELLILVLDGNIPSSLRNACPAC